MNIIQTKMNEVLIPRTWMGMMDQRTQTHKVTGHISPCISKAMPTEADH